MDIVTRTFFKLLALGAFNEKDSMEPMSACKWRSLFRLAAMHDVMPIISLGMKNHADDFFMQVPNELPRMQSDAKETKDTEEEDNEMLQPDHLTNPLLNFRLQNILKKSDSTEETVQLILMILGIAKFLMNEGFPVKQLVELGLFLRRQGDKVDFIKLQEWIKSIHMERMSQLIGELLVRLFKFEKEEIPFMTQDANNDIDSIMKEIYILKSARTEKFYFSQGQKIFVQTPNSTAILWNVRHSSKYFKYCPSESFTNFFALFTHSLSHIEE